jgi:hypothetical protein
MELSWQSPLFASTKQLRQKCCLLVDSPVAHPALKKLVLVNDKKAAKTAAFLSLEA